MALAFSWDDARLLDVVQVGEVGLEKCIALSLDHHLALAFARGFGILAIGAVTPRPNDANPCGSRNALSLKLMNTCVVRESTPEVANVIMPRLLLWVTGSSAIRAFLHHLEIAGSPLMPNWTMKLGTTRKNRFSSYHAFLTKL